ncbi:ArdC family protein [Rothia nasimurium]|uniref:ArdC family protein n=1 Tax=Rothia nasimurium TaxID=85336 RepID=UPI001F278FB8|nr:ArdC family protein [Rothia nasimurium]
MATATNRKAAKEELKAELHQKAAAVAEEIKTNPATATRFQKFSRRFESYSEKNQHLIFVQNENATECAGFQQWKKSGRQVMKGERGIKIFAPTKFTVKDEEGKPQKDENGEDKKRDGFIMVTVFDISQTEEITQ